MKRNNNITRIGHLGSLYSRNLEDMTELKQSYKVHTRVKGTVSKYIVKEGEAPSNNGYPCKC
jgi:hypothetical protein